jgi:predicted GIY-YIG superfamily endonuclease
MNTPDSSPIAAPEELREPLYTEDPCETLWSRTEENWFADSGSSPPLELLRAGYSTVETYYIYGLQNEQGKMYYIGCSMKPKQRLSALKLNLGHVCKGPRLFILHETSSLEEAIQTELATIQQYRLDGHPLENSLKPARYHRSA